MHEIRLAGVPLTLHAIDYKVKIGGSLEADSPRRVFTSCTCDFRAPRWRKTGQDELARVVPNAYIPITRANDDDLLLLNTVNAHHVVHLQRKRGK